MSANIRVNSATLKGIQDGKGKESCYADVYTQDSDNLNPYTAHPILKSLSTPIKLVVEKTPITMHLKSGFK